MDRADAILVQQHLVLALGDGQVIPVVHPLLEGLLEQPGHDIQGHLSGRVDGELGVYVLQHGLGGPVVVVERLLAVGEAAPSAHNAAAAPALDAAFGAPAPLVLLREVIPSVVHILLVVPDHAGLPLDHQEGVVQVEDVGFLDVVVHLLELDDDGGVEGDAGALGVADHPPEGLLQVGSGVEGEDVRGSFEP